MLTYEAALARILKQTPSPRIVHASLDEALGLVLAHPVIARQDLPQFDNSAVDGYAVHLNGSAPTNGHASAPLRVIGRAEAGRPFSGRVGTMQAVRILTGAQVPPGADAVVMQEQTMRQGDALRVQRWPSMGQHIRRRGEDLPQGSRALEAGTRLRPQEIGLLAALGYRHVPVMKPPMVTILVTGDELQPPSGPLKSGHIYESNSALLSALVQQVGARGVRLGLARDGVPSLVRKIRQGLGADVCLVAGGISVGDKDLVREAMRRCGVRQLFWRVDIKPGMPLFVGKRGRTLVFGLPGNPVSVYVTFQEFVKPALYALLGRAWHDGYAEAAVLVDGLNVSHTRRTHFVRVKCSDHNLLVAQPLTGQDSHHLRGLVEADGWIRVAADQGPWVAGARVMVKRRDAQHEAP